MPILLLLLALFLAACASAPTPVLPTLVIPPTASATATAVPPTPLPAAPSPTPTEVASPTPTVINEVPWPHLPPSTTVSLLDLQMTDALLGWAIGQDAAQPTNHHILRTRDGGLTWQDVTPPHPFESAVSTGLRAVGAFRDANTAWVTFVDASLQPTATLALVWRTTDGGQTWTASTPLEGAEAEFYQPAYFSFPNPHDGWLLAHVGAGMMNDYVFIFRTRDGGATWQRVVDPFLDNLPMGCYKNAMAFTNANIGWVLGDCAGASPELYVYRTTDGGDTWAAALLPSPTEDPNLFATQACGAKDPTFLTPQNGRLLVFCDSADPAGARSWMYFTESGGATWVSHPLPTGVGTLMVINVIEAWYIGATSLDPAQPQYQLYRAANAGQTWVPIQTLSWTGPIEWLNGQTGLALAQTGATPTLLQTTDGGMTWNALTPLIGP